MTTENEDNFDLDLGEDKSEENNRINKRLKSLSEKVELSEKDKAEMAEKAKSEGEARVKVEKERDFYKTFNNIATKYPGAAEYQDQILEKVNSGYDAEDAAVAILAKEGKYTPQPEKMAPLGGGSASIGIHDLGEKPLGEMKREEMRAQLLDLESKGEFKL